MCLTVSRRSRDLSVSMHSHSFQDTKFKLLIQVKEFQEQVVEGLTVLRYPGSEIKGSSLKKTLIQHAFAQFSRYRVETLQVRQWLTGTGRGGVGDSTVPRLKLQKTLFDTRPTVAWPPTTVAWPFSDFFSKNFQIARNVQNVVWQSADGRVTSDHCRVTVQRLFSKFLLTAWNVEKTLFDSRQTVTWSPTTVAWPFSDFFQKISKLLKTSKKRCLTVGWRSRDLRPLSRDRSATFFKIFPNRLKGPNMLFDSRPTVAWPPTTVAWLFSDFFQKISNCLKRRKIVIWQSADGRVTSDHCRVTVQRLFSKFSQIAWNVQKTLFDSRPTVAWPQPLLRDRSATLFEVFPNRLKRPKNVVWQSADGRVTSDHYRVTVQQLFFKFSFNWLKRLKTLFDSRPMVAWPPTTVAWPFSDFFQNFPKSLETSKKRCLTVGRWSRDLRPLSRDRSWTFFKIFSNGLKRSKNVVWQSAVGHVTSTTVAWPFSVFFQKFFQLLDTSENSCLTVGRRSRQLRLGWNVEEMLFECQRTVTWRSGPFVTVVLFVRLHILPRRCISRYYYYYRDTLRRWVMPHSPLPFNFQDNHRYPSAGTTVLLFYDV